MVSVYTSLLVKVKPFERKSREVTIHELEMIGWKPGDHPELLFVCFVPKVPTFVHYALILDVH